MSHTLDDENFTIYTAEKPVCEKLIFALNFHHITDLFHLCHYIPHGRRNGGIIQLICNMIWYLTSYKRYPAWRGIIERVQLNEVVYSCRSFAIRFIIAIK